MADRFNYRKELIRMNSRQLLHYLEMEDGNILSLSIVEFIYRVAEAREPKGDLLARELKRAVKCKLKKLVS